jgi:cellulose synthase/poly-beta-1,6-N-acetylglucosamine synthase-like glycosyltransferase
LEFAGLVLTGAGLIGTNKPVICNAANIAYRKKIFIEVGGFNDKVKLSSGDDELLMQKIRRETDFKIKFCWDYEAVVKTSSNSDLTQFYNQRKRWASKGLFYGNKMLVFKLILIYFFYVGLISQLALSLFVSLNYLILFILSIALKYLLEYKIVKKGKILLSLINVMKIFPIAEFLQIPYIIIAGFSGVFGNFYWKQRRIKR